MSAGIGGGNGLTRDGRRRVVVTGMGTINPLGQTLAEYWDGLARGRNAARAIESFDTTRLATRFGCQVVGFDPLNHMERKLVGRTARFTHLSLAASAMAVTDSGLDLGKEDPYRMGVELGSGIGGLPELDAASVIYSNGGRIGPFLLPMIIPNMAAAQVAMQHGLKGPNQTVVTACAASTHAIGGSYRTIALDEADVMLTGGSESAFCAFGFGAFNSIRAMSTRNDDPEHASRPFDKDRDGFVFGEGAGTLVLEALDHALGRGARIYGEVLGYGSTNDAFHQVAPDETAEAPARCIQVALGQAGIAASEVDYVNAHGTSTGLNDVMETRALKIALGDHAHRVAISSTKSMLGHLFGAAGAVEAIATLLVMQHDTVHPTINYETPDPECDLDYVPNQPRHLGVRTAISNNFGFGGQNASLVFRKYED